MILLGLLSRTSIFPESWLKSNAGDALWAMMIYFGFAFLIPNAKIRTLTICAASFCLVIELSQLWQHPWLVTGRENRFGALVLGRGFLWIDLARYAAGILMGMGIDWLIHRRK
ncbi:MAG: DUF2809 domain-containing protein [Verrucomicrobiota bacterium]